MADLTALLDKEASAEIEAIRSEAQSRASEIVAKAEEEAEAIRTNRERAAKQQRDAALVRARSAAQLEAASLKLTTQQGAIEEVFDAAERKLDAYVENDSDYAATLAALLSEAVAAVGGADRVAKVIVHPDERAAAEKAAASAGVKDKLATDADVRGGVRVVATNRIVVANTLYGRLEALREELASEVAETLHEKEA